MAILIGTASWTDKSLIDSGLFYPASIKTPADRLRFYADRFPLVEVDSSYYALPSARNAVLWIERTPPDFVFNVKSFRLFTQHQTPPSALPKDIRTALGPPQSNNFYYRDLPEELLSELWQRFRTAIEPLQAAGRLGIILLQFPPWFVYRPSNLGHILHCAERLAGYRLAIEFRHRSWFEGERRAEVLQFERDHGIVHVVVDEPQGFSTSIPAVWEATSPAIAVVRLHGRNRDTWNQKGLTSSADRFNYLYSLDELHEFISPIQQLADRVQQAHIIFNNNFGNYAQRNAGELQQLLLPLHENRTQGV